MASSSEFGHCNQLNPLSPPFQVCRRSYNGFLEPVFGLSISGSLRQRKHSNSYFHRIWHSVLYQCCDVRCMCIYVCMHVYTHTHTYVCVYICAFLFKNAASPLNVRKVSGLQCKCKGGYTCKCTFLVDYYVSTISLTIIVTVSRFLKSSMSVSQTKTSSVLGSSYPLTH